MPDPVLSRMPSSFQTLFPQGQLGTWSSVGLPGTVCAVSIMTATVRLPS